MELKKKKKKKHSLRAETPQTKPMVSNVIKPSFSRVYTKCNHPAEAHMYLGFENGHAPGSAKLVALIASCHVAVSKM